MPSISLPAAAIGAGVLGAGASIYAGSEQASAAKSAANTSLAEANNSNALIQGIYDSNKAMMSPFVNAGTSALTQLQGLTGTNAGGNPLTASLTAPFASTPGGQLSALQQTPGYQFTLQQGELATQAGSSAQGMGSAVAGVGSGQTPGIGPSGPLGKSLANYASGLAATTYQQQYSNYLTQNQQIYNMLAGQVTQGVNAGSTVTQAGTAAGGQSANALLTGSAQSGSFATAGAAATAAGVTGAASSLGNSALLYGILGGGSGSGTNSTSSNALT
jgi:hypothetical protein